MAIGDTVQAGLMRTDSSPILLAGQAQAKANQAFGDALNTAAQGYFRGQEKKKKLESTKEGLRSLFPDAPDGLINSMAKNPEVAQTKMALEKLAIQRESIASAAASAGAARAQAAAFQQDKINERNRILKEAEEKEQKQIGLSNFVMSGTEMDPEVLEDFNQAQPGLFALGGDQGARNRFLESQRDTAPKVGKLGGELDSSEFASKAMEAGVDPVLAGNYFMKLQAREAEASKGTGKTMNVYDPNSEQNVIALQNPDGTPGRVVGIAPTQPPRIADPKDVRQANINKTEDNQAMATEADWKGRALTGRNTIQTVKTMLNTLDKVDDTGGFADFKNTLTKYAMSAGFDFTDAEKEELANAEKFTQLSGEFVFKAISQTKGSISEKEMDLFQAMSPSMVNSKLGNRLMLEYAQKRADRDVRLNKYIQGLKKGGMLPQERVEMAMDWLNDPKNDITQDLYEHFGTTTNSSTPPPQAQPNRSGVRGSNPPPNSNAQTVNGFKILKK